MRALHVLVLSNFAIATGATGCSGSDGEAGSSCTVTRNDAGSRATITCDDGTSAVITSGAPAGCTVAQSGNTRTIRCDDGTKIDIPSGGNGRDGTDGKNGKDGVDGAPGANGMDGVDGVDGTDGVNGADGAPGAPGSDGMDGANGTNGTSAGVIGAGLKVEISGVTIPSDRKPVVSLSLEDDSNHALDRTGATTPGAVSVSFVLAYLQSAGGIAGQYVPYNVGSVTGKTVMGTPPALPSAMQPKSDAGGTWTLVDASAGTYTYKFGVALPANYDGTKTHTLAAYASRTFEGVQYADDPAFHFRPDGQPVSEHREIVVTQTCNKCHDSLRVHGGSRFELGLCVTCHTDGMSDPESGNSIDFRQMIHKIHRGQNLPSVKGGGEYRLVGYGDTEHDYSDVVFPQAMENCTTCHEGGADSDRWKTHMSRSACTSCHDLTTFDGPGATHTAGMVNDDSLCANCHQEGRAHIGPYEVDVTRVHRPQTKWPLRDLTTGVLISEAPVVTGSVVSVTVQSGQAPVITFRVQVDGQPWDILAGGQALSSLRFTFAAPTTDYVGYSQYTAQGSGAVGTLVSAGTPGEFTWTASQTIENVANATAAATGSSAFPLEGTMAVGMEGRLTRPATPPQAGANVNVNYAMHNDVFYVALTDPQAVARREATVVANCNTCHEDLTAHGGTRNDPEYCVLCHSATRDTITRMPAPVLAALATTTNLRLSHMVHRIHTGEDGVNPYVAYTPSAPLDFSEVRFPGDRRNCAHCHVPGQFELPLPDGLLASRWSDIDSTRMRVTNYYMGATAAACTGCHDSDSAAVHAATMSIVANGDPSSIAEGCPSCHASGKQFGLDKVHAHPAP